MIKKNILWFIMVLICIFLGAMSKNMTLIMLVSSGLCAWEISGKYLKEPNYSIVEGILLLLMFQNFCIGCGAHIFENMNSSLKYLTQIPFLTVVIIWGRIVLNNFKNKKIDKSFKIFVLWCVCILFSIFIGRGSLQACLLNIRNMTFFYMVYTIGEYNIQNEDDLKPLVKFIVNLSFIFLVFGIILNIGGYRLYKIIGINEVYIAKGIGYLGKLDGRFTTIVINKQVNRMGSLMYEPVNLAYFYAFAVLITVFSNWTSSKINRMLCSSICFLGLVLTYGKGGYLIVITSMLCLFLEKIINNIIMIDNGKSKKRNYKLVAILIVMFLIVFSVFYYIKIGAAAKQHFWGIIKTWKTVMKKPIGYGLGTGGNSAKALDKNFIKEDWLSTGGETSIMSFMYQVGIQGIVCFVFTLLSMRPKKISKNHNSYFKLTYYFPIVLIVLGLLQDNTFTPQCITTFMIFQGGIKTISENLEKDSINKK